MADEQQSDKKDELERKVRRRVGLEQKAYNIVHHLLENTVSHQYLVEAGQVITPSHYQDAVDERSIINLCGFPLCQNNLSYVPKQKYHISLKNKKVFDITERKKFCSNQCFKASENFMKQISLTPVWGREEEPPVSFTILPPDNEGSAGETIVGSSVLYGDIKDVLQQTEAIDKRCEISQIDDKHKISGSKDTSKTSVTQLEMETMPECVNRRDQPSSLKSNKGTNESINSRYELHIDSNSKSNYKSLEGTVASSKNGIPISDSISKEYKKTGDKNLQPTTDDDIMGKEYSARGEKEKSAEMNIPVYDKTAVDMCEKKNKTDDSVTKVNKGTSNDYLLQLLQKKKQKLTNFIQIENMDKKCLGVDVQEVKSSEKDKKNDKTLEITHQKHLMTERTTHSTFQSLVYSQQSSDSPVLKQSIVLLLCKTVEQWITLDTLKFLNKTSHMKQQPADTFEEKYLALCKKLDSGELNIEDEVDICNEEASNIATKPIPCYEKLNKETEKFQIKVKDFLEGKEVSRKKGNDTRERDPLLPVVDSHNQLSIRQKIVSDQLDKVLHDVLKPLNLTLQEVTSDMKSLISSFYFTNTNILFKPQEWIIVAIILVVMLARCSTCVRSALLNVIARKHFNKIMNSLKCSLAELESAVGEMTEIKA